MPAPAINIFSATVTTSAWWLPVECRTEDQIWNVSLRVLAAHQGRQPRAHSLGRARAPTAGEVTWPAIADRGGRPAGDLGQRWVSVENLQRLAGVIPAIDHGTAGRGAASIILMALFGTLHHPAEDHPV